MKFDVLKAPVTHLKNSYAEYADAVEMVFQGCRMGFGFVWLNRVAG